MLRNTLVRLTALAAVVGAVGFAAASVLTPTASAWDYGSLPNGYSVTTDSGVSGCSPATYVWVNGSGIGCTSDSGFQSALDSYINSTICSVNPAAGGSACVTTTAPTTTAATTTSAATTTTAGGGASGGGTTTAPTGSRGGQATTNAQAPTGTSTTSTVTVTTTVTDATLTSRVSALEQRLAVDEARLDVLESHTTVLGEIKNETPFTDPA